MLLVSLLVLKSYFPMPPMEKNKGIFVEKKSACHTLLLLTG